MLSTIARHRASYVCIARHINWLLWAGGAGKPKGDGSAGKNQGDGQGGQGGGPRPHRQQNGGGNRRGGHSQAGGHAMAQGGLQQGQAKQDAPGRPQEPQLPHGLPLPPTFNPSLSLAQALGLVLSRYSDMLAADSEVDLQMRQHPQGIRWRSCLEVMVEQSVRHGALHPECPDIHLAVHSVPMLGPNGGPSQVIMVSHPAAAPFKFYCEFLWPSCRCLSYRAHLLVHIIGPCVLAQCR